MQKLIHSIKYQLHTKKLLKLKSIKYNEYIYIQIFFYFVLNFTNPTHLTFLPFIFNFLYVHPLYILRNIMR